jgi:glycosyltransferase involved in cell wall biosynthesis
MGKLPGKISIVCPFFNEEAIIESSVQLMLDNLSRLDREWELIIVDDGSTDRSFEIAQSLAIQHAKLSVLHYPSNRGRGHAIRFGAARASGDILITTEIDSSWGDDIVARIVKVFEDDFDTDLVIASPHLPGGGYKNVPLRRILISRVGNWLLRRLLGSKMTMFTGMTRGYKRRSFNLLPLHEPGKELHLEILDKADAFNFHIKEVPATIEWKKFHGSKMMGKRKSASRIFRLIGTHLLFGVGVAPFRYLLPVAVVLAAIAMFFMLVAIVQYMSNEPSILIALVSFITGLFGFVIFGIGLLAHQNRAIIHEIWRQSKHHDI